MSGRNERWTCNRSSRWTFDGTLCEHDFPEIGAENPGGIWWCRKFQELGARLVLYTMRSDLHAPGETSYEGHAANRAYLRDAVDWCAERGLRFWSHNENPEQGSWTNSPKPYAHLYVDDAALGCPLIYRPPARPMVDWGRAGPDAARRLWPEIATRVIFDARRAGAASV